jgi:hypothetical protein
MKPDLVKAIAQAKKYSDRECFADSRAGMEAWLAMGDLLIALGVNPKGAA